MDIREPMRDGLVATRHIRDWERQNGIAPIPIIALLAPAPAQRAAESIEAGCTAHLTKPVTGQTLLQALIHCQNRTAEPEPRKPAVVEVPPALKALVPRYLDGRHKDVETLRSALA